MNTALRFLARPTVCYVAYLSAGLPAMWAADPSPRLTLTVTDYVEMPVTGLIDGKGQTNGMLARVNALREEPGGAARFFVVDLNGPLYILDKATRTLTTYLDFNGRDDRPGLFHKLAFDTGFAGGLMGVQFDPDYARNGKFYTVHMEDPALPGSDVPDNAHVPGVDVRGYTTTSPIPTPGPIQREGVLIEWTDTHPSNATFEGSARELMRVQLNARIHPLADLAFNPAARRGDPEWRVLYVGCGDGGSGESKTAIRTNPQRLDTLVGKILRIIPDPREHRGTSTVSHNGRYRIPNDNPFVSTAGARKEVWALGLRNPHRLTWAIDPGHPRHNRLIANSVGLHFWETVDIIHRGANYGYSLREGNEVLQANNTTTALPEIDRIPVQVADALTDRTVAPAYPVIQYWHAAGGGDAIGSGFLYRGKAVPLLRGKYIFTDISTGRIWYADYHAMLAADDGNPRTMAAAHEVAIRWTDSQAAADAASSLYETMFPIAKAAYHRRGGQARELPGRARVSGEGRADVQLAVDRSGELYLLSKTDGMIRAVVAGVIH